MEVCICVPALIHKASSELGWSTAVKLGGGRGRRWSCEVGVGRLRCGHGCWGRCHCMMRTHVCWSQTLLPHSAVELRILSHFGPNILYHFYLRPMTVRKKLYCVLIQPHTDYQSSIDWASKPRASIACSAVSASVYTVVSSAYIFMHPCLPVLGRSFTNRTNISGPRIEPWGTPYLGSSQGELTFPILTLWRLPLK